MDESWKLSWLGLVLCVVVWHGAMVVVVMVVVHRQSCH